MALREMIDRTAASRVARRAGAAPDAGVARRGVTLRGMRAGGTGRRGARRAADAAAAGRGAQVLIAHLVVAKPKWQKFEPQPRIGASVGATGKTIGALRVRCRRASISITEFVEERSDSLLGRVSYSHSPIE